jgi:hypothetical protein
MDFISKLPLSSKFDNILVIVDKLTEYTIFIPTTISVTEVETAKLFFHHFISKFGIPRQAIMDRDARWKGEFWKEICKRMGVVRSLTTAYHPQADDQTEVLNQCLEIFLCGYVGLSRNDWVNHLNALALSYNTTPHTAIGFAPAYLLRGYILTTRSTLVHHPEGIARPATGMGSHNVRDLSNIDEKTLHPAALEMSEAFHATRYQAQVALRLEQHSKDNLTIRDASL